MPKWKTNRLINSISTKNEPLTAFQKKYTEREYSDSECKHLDKTLSVSTSRINENNFFFFMEFSLHKKK